MLRDKGPTAKNKARKSRSERLARRVAVINTFPEPLGTPPRAPPGSLADTVPRPRRREILDPTGPRGRELGRDLARFLGQIGGQGGNGGQPWSKPAGPASLPPMAD